MLRWALSLLFTAGAAFALEYAALDGQALELARIIRNVSLGLGLFALAIAWSITPRSRSIKQPPKTAENTRS